MTTPTKTTTETRTDVTNAIKTLNWYQVQNGDLQAGVGTGLLTIHYQDREEEPVWKLSYTTFPQSLGEHTSLTEAIRAADEFVGDL
jgi:hypothetical protein